MALSKEELESLYNKYIQNRCTAEELQTLAKELGEDSPAFREDLVNELFDRTWEGLKVFPGQYRLPELALPWKREEQAPVISLSSRKRWLCIAVATIILFLGAGTYMWMTRVPKPGLVKVGNRLENSVPPGGNKAVLTLANGSKIILDSAANGNLGQQGSARIVKVANGQIVYNMQDLSQKEILWNTLNTPAGGQYQITLPDGTKVWLNAASSITYPVAFVGIERRVKISGEVYFEVFKNKQKPFIVDIDGRCMARVLGTSFNISSYADESNIKTTLIEGTLKVSHEPAPAGTASSDLQPRGTAKAGPPSVILTPGQQAVAGSSDRDLKLIENPDINQTLAWKNGVFDFNGADLKAVMKQLERWYDIKVQYKPSMANMVFEGRMYRNVNLSDVLQALQEMGVKFKVEGKMVIVL